MYIPLILQLCYSRLPISHPPIWDLRFLIWSFWCNSRKKNINIWDGIWPLFFFLFFFEAVCFTNNLYQICTNNVITVLLLTSSAHSAERLAAAYQFLPSPLGFCCSGIMMHATITCQCMRASSARSEAWHAQRGVRRHRGGAELQIWSETVAHSAQSAKHSIRLCHETSNRAKNCVCVSKNVYQIPSTKNLYCFPRSFLSTNTFCMTETGS